VPATVQTAQEVPLCGVLAVCPPRLGVLWHSGHIRGVALLAQTPNQSKKSPLFPAPLQAFCSMYVRIICGSHEIRRIALTITTSDHKDF